MTEKAITRKYNKNNLIVQSNPSGQNSPPPKKHVQGKSKKKIYTYAAIQEVHIIRQLQPVQVSVQKDIIT